MARDPRPPALATAERCRATERAVEEHLRKARDATDRALLLCVRAGWSQMALARALGTSGQRIRARLDRASAQESVARR